MKKLLILLLVLALVVGIGALLFRHFVTNRITDRGGMENPEFSEAAYHPNIESGARMPQTLQEEHHGTV